MEVRYERDSLDTTEFVTLPIKVTINNQQYSVQKWSLTGFYIEAQQVFDQEADIPVDLVLPFRTHETVLKAKCRLSAFNTGQCYFTFQNLPQANRKLMRDYYESSLHAIETTNVDYQLATPQTPEQVQSNNNTLVRRLAIYMVLFGVIGVLSWFLWREFSYVYSLRGTVMGDLVQYKSPDQNYIKWIFVKDGERVEEGTLLYELNHDIYDAKLAQLKKWQEKAINEVNAARNTVMEEDKRTVLYAQVAEKKLKMMLNQRQGLESQIETSWSMFERDRKLYGQLAIAKEVFEVSTGNYNQLKSSLKQLDDLIELQKIVIKESKNNRYVSSTDTISYGMNNNLGVTNVNTGQSLGIFDIKMTYPAALENLARKETFVEELGSQIVELEQCIKRCLVHSSSEGFVNHVNRRPGDWVTNSDYVLSVQVEDDTTYVACRFTTDDAKFIQYGMECKIISIPRGQTYMGRVVAIGHSGLSSSGALSADEETALDQLVVKFELPKESQLRGGEGVYVKVNRAWSLSGFMEKLR